MEAMHCRLADNYFQLFGRRDDASARVYAMVCLKRGAYKLAKEYIEFSLSIATKAKTALAPIENTYLYGQLYALLNNWAVAENWYRKGLEYRWTGRRYFECAIITGLIRVKHAQGDPAAILPLLAEAKQLAQQYEYNDHLASLRLTQGHLAWESGKQDEALAFYQHAMTYALRYNRFLLDELLSGRQQGTPLRPIIPYCLERGEEGKKVLSSLMDWWKTGINDNGTPRPDTISPIPEGILLLDAEKIARERELGDGSVQRRVVEQIEAVL